MKKPLVKLVLHEGEKRKQMVTSPSGKRYALTWRKVSESKGKPQAGQLIDASRLPKRGIGYRHQGKRPFGTDETVVYLQFAAWAVAELFPGTAPVLIQDISDDDGGHAPPHRSHRTGRDVDIGWYHTGNKGLRWLESLDVGELDMAKSWTFIEALLRTGAVQYIFIDKTIQERLHDHLANQGWSRDTLDAVFQYPAENNRAVIRHVRGHKNHMHVRFVCPPEDEDCLP